MNPHSVNTLHRRVENLSDTQLTLWPDARKRYERLRDALTRSITLPGGTFELIHLPDRAVSTCARTDARSIAARPCFLCESNRPDIQQGIKLTNRDMEILVNPFPIFPRHLTIPSTTHIPQHYSKPLLVKMLSLARDLRDYTVFYNGPHSGASAPDHLHLQAVGTSTAGLSQISRSISDADCRIVKSKGDTRMLIHPHLTVRPVSVIGSDISEVADMMFNALSLLPIRQGEIEPRLNLYATHNTENDMTALTAVLRNAHRPSCYGDGGVIFSPGAIDMGGRIVLPRKSDFDTLTADSLQSMMEEVLLPQDIYNRFILDCISHPL